MHTHKPTGTDTHTHTCRSQNTIRKFNKYRVTINLVKMYFQFNNI